MKKIKRFFDLLKFEVIKISRNKLLLIFLITFPLLMTFTVNSIHVDYNSNNSGQQQQEEELSSNPNGYIALYSNGDLDNEEEIVQIVQNYYNNGAIQIVNSFEEGELLLKQWEVYFFIVIDTTSEPVSAVFYYDKSSNVGNYLVGELRKEQLKYTYTSLVEFLQTYGITINEDYFNLITFESIQQQSINQKQRIMPLTSSFVAVIVMFGLAYSMARDNETNVIKQISYTPISVHKYLFSKAIPFLILGVIQAILLLFIGWFVYGIGYQANVALIGLMYVLYVTATISLGLIFSSFNNQTTSTFATMIAILLPIFASYWGFINSYPALIKIALYMFPLSIFSQMFTQMTFNGVLLPILVVILCVQTVGYYFVAYALANKKAGG